MGLDDHGYLGVGGDDEGGEGVSRLEPVPSILILHNVARQEQAGHTAGHQTAPVRVLRQLSNGLLSTIFASKAVTSNDNPAIDVNVNSRTNLDIGGLNARAGNFPVSQEETTLWSEEFGPK